MGGREERGGRGEGEEDGKGNERERERGTGEEERMVVMVGMITMKNIEDVDTQRTLLHASIGKNCSLKTNRMSFVLV